MALCRIGEKQTCANVLSTRHTTSGKPIKHRLCNVQYISAVNSSVQWARNNRFLVHRALQPTYGLPFHGKLPAVVITLGNNGFEKNSGITSKEASLPLNPKKHHTLWAKHYRPRCRRVCMYIRHHQQSCGKRGRTISKTATERYTADGSAV